MADVNGNAGDNNLVGLPEADTINGFAGNDTIAGLGANDAIFGGSGDDVANVNFPGDGADSVDLGTGNDLVNVTGTAFGQIRLSFTSAQVGNGSAVDSNTMANQDGGLAVRFQTDAGDVLGAAVARYDDEGITFAARTLGLTFDVRDLVNGAARGDQFQVVTLGTDGGETLNAVQNVRPYYFNAGAGNDIVNGGFANDFLVGGGGNDQLNGGNGNDSFIGGGGSDTIDGGAGFDLAIFNVSTDGADSVNLGATFDTVNVQANSPGQIRLSFTSAQVGNNSALDSNTMANQDGGLAVRLQGENGAGDLTGDVSRFDDEDIQFVAGTPGVTFDIRDLVSGVERGNQFEVVQLGTGNADMLSAGQPGRPYYFNAGAGNDTIVGGNSNDFLVGGAGNDSLTGGNGNDSFIGGGGNDSISGGRGTDTVIFASNFTDAGVTFTGGTASFTTSEGVDRVSGAEVFRFNDRTIDTNDGRPLVDDLFYLANNRDVAAAGIDADDHYFANGAREGRDPNAFFSTNGYLSANPDVRAAGVNPLTHYERDGFREGRDPSVNFDNEAYLRANPDVRAAGINPLAHFLADGIEEGRQAFVASGTPADIAANSFDREFYLLSNPDVGFANIDAQAHYNTNGFREGRNPNAFFDTNAYLNTYTDVRAAGLNPLEHYNANGFREGRDPSTRFDTSLYLDANPDVRAAGINPLFHFLEFGRAEGRTNFDDGTLLA